jgi:hypothetical protein
MSDIPDIDATGVDRLLSALGQQLRARRERYSIIVVGGSALLVLGVIARTTRDVDVVALLRDESIVSAHPLPEGLLAAAHVVAADFRLSESWLNTGPTSLLDFGLPDGFLERAKRHAYGQALEALFASREDQIHFKLYAVVDQGAGKHLADLQALAPSEAELLQAARWTRTHDPSEGYRDVLLQVLAHFGVTDGPDLV